MDGVDLWTSDLTGIQILDTLRLWASDLIRLSPCRRVHLR